MRIFTATLVTETNTFSPIPTGRRAFDRGAGQPDVASMAEWRHLAARDGHSVVESIIAVAQPAGPTVGAVYEELRDELLADLRAALPVDVILLYLHGAMVAQGYDDCEGDVLEHCRTIAGETAVVGAELDLHAHLTQRMLDAANAIVLYKEYPHVDTVERARDLYRICLDAAARKTRPVCAVYDCRTIGMFPTTAEPMRSFVDEMSARERDGILSLSLVHGFPYGDVPDVGTKVLAIADRDEALAKSVAQHFGRRFQEIRGAALLRGMPLDDALDLVERAAEGPIVLADVADNAGGGAPGDSTFILRALLERGIESVATGTYYDPMAVATCFEAGEGAEIDLRFGGKTGVASGDPIDARVEIVRLSETHWQDYMDDSRPASLGKSAWIRTQGIDIVLASVRAQVFSTNAFTGLGITLGDKRAIVVKSS
ncbi:MAG TPA: M81 family metallopeptidase, partial [Candidatus Aquilonibacter sp.]|nr:M81 family metallopeptidase [Candidatus Aquilonibacter sp.]